MRFQIKALNSLYRKKYKVLWIYYQAEYSLKIIELILTEYMRAFKKPISKNIPTNHIINLIEAETIKATIPVIKLH